MALNRLGQRDGVALVERVAGDASLSGEIVAEIVERADGVPLFVEELTKAVLETQSCTAHMRSFMGGMTRKCAPRGMGPCRCGILATRIKPPKAPSKP